MYQDLTPKVSPPSFALDQCLRVTYAGASTVPELNRAIDGRHTMIESVVGDTLSFSVTLGNCRPMFSLVRTPPSDRQPPADLPPDGPIRVAYDAIERGSANMDGGRVATSRPGAWVVRCTLPGGWSRDIVIACFDARALDRMEWPIDHKAQRRARLRAIVNHHVHGAPTLATVVDALETHADGCYGITGRLIGAPGISVRDYGGG